MTKSKILLAGAAVLAVAVSGVAYAQQGRGPMRDRLADRAGGVLMLRAADADNDGAVTRGEADMLQAEIFTWKDRNGDGALDVNDLGPLERRLAEARGDRMDDPWARPRRADRADADQDGRITLADLSVQTDAVFERLDADGDGRITAEEARSARADRRPGRGGPGGDGARP